MVERGTYRQAITLSNTRTEINLQRGADEFTMNFLAAITGQTHFPDLLQIQI